MKKLLLIFGVLLLTACQTTKVNYLNTQELQKNHPRIMAFNIRVENGLEMHRETLKTQLEPNIHAVWKKKVFNLYHQSVFTKYVQNYLLLNKTYSIQ